jgi:SH3 domain protein
MRLRAALPVLFAAAAASLSAAAAEFRSTAEAATILYDAPSNRSKKLYVVSRGYPVQVIVTVEGWQKVRDASGELAWVESKALAARRTVVVRARVADVREAPDDASKVAFQAAQNVLLELVEAVPGGWARVQHADGSAGFVRASQLWGV